MKTPIEMMLDGVTWVPAEGIVGGEYPAGDVPVATHSGVLEIMGHKLKCYRLSNGMTVFDADDMMEFWNRLAEE